MTCFVSLGWWALHPRAAICIVWQYAACRHMHVYKHSRTQIAFRKLHHFPAVVWKLHLSPTVAPITPWVSFISLLLPLPLSLFLSLVLPHYFKLYLPLSRGPKLPGPGLSLWAAWGWTGPAGDVCECTSYCVITNSFHFPLRVMLSGARQDITLSHRSLPPVRKFAKKMDWKDENKSKQNACFPDSGTTTANNQSRDSLCSLIPSATGAWHGSLGEDNGTTLCVLMKFRTLLNTISLPDPAIIFNFASVDGQHQQYPFANFRNI